MMVDKFVPRFLFPRKECFICIWNVKAVYYLAQEDVS